METMAKINKNYIDGIVEWINFNSIMGITISQIDLARQYKIEIDDIIKYSIHAERIFINTITMTYCIKHRQDTHIT